MASQAALAITTEATGRLPSPQDQTTPLEGLPADAAHVLFPARDIALAGLMMKPPEMWATWTSMLGPDSAWRAGHCGCCAPGARTKKNGALAAWAPL